MNFMQEHGLAKSRSHAHQSMEILGWQPLTCGDSEGHNMSRLINFMRNAFSQSIL